MLQGLESRKAAHPMPDSFGLLSFKWQNDICKKRAVSLSCSTNPASERPELEMRGLHIWRRMCHAQCSCDANLAARNVPTRSLGRNVLSAKFLRANSKLNVSLPSFRRKVWHEVSVIR